jgi:23S rRNA pseudouridine1911/1915/1917 synthase
MSTQATIDILYQDRQVIVVNKPAGLLSQGDKTGDMPVAEVVRQLVVGQLAEGGKPAANPFVAPVHRLDRPVSGALALARTSKSARRLSEAFREASVAKGYLALVEGAPPAGVFRLWLKKNRKINQVSARTNAYKGAVEAITRIQPIMSLNSCWLVALFPSTGRPHQLRVTLAHFGLPIIGDVRYGSTIELDRTIALHAHLLRFQHPTQGHQISVFAPMPCLWTERFKGLTTALGACCE